MNRRKFLIDGGVLSTALTSVCGKLSLAAQHVASGGSDGGYKALVCIFLHGGNDSFNMLVPADKERYKDYVNARGDMALSLNAVKDQAIELADKNLQAPFAVHPACAQIANLFEENRLAFVANVGTLVEPTSIKSVLAGSAKLPSSLFSHNDQRSQWQSLAGEANSATGWLGRAADLYFDRASDTSFSMNVSLSGSNLMQTGRWVVPYSISADGPVNVNSPSVIKALKSTVGSHSEPSVLEQVFRDTHMHAFQRNELFAELFNRNRVQGYFSNGSLGKSLRAVATTIAASDMLGQSRQTFFILHKGWDTHQEQIDRHAYLLGELSEQLYAFDTTLREIGHDKNVTTFTASEFGRTLRSNGRGTDHGWGGVSIVAGGAVNGGRVFGQYPDSLALGAGMDVGKNGRLLPSLASDQYIAPLLSWFGLTQSQLNEVLPNLERFSSPGDDGELSEMLSTG